MGLRENPSIVVELDGVGARNIAAVHPYRSRDAGPEVGFDRAPQCVVHPMKARTGRGCGRTSGPGRERGGRGARRRR
jgi:hypothetical protein